LKELLINLESVGKKLVKLDAEKLAHDSNLPNIVSNLIMLGALAGACIELPVSKGKLKGSIRENVPSKFTEVNIKAFDLGFEEAKHHS
jgi:indolepyruvate ferredoxin oxidoreductase beta subunit